MGKIAFGVSTLLLWLILCLSILSYKPQDLPTSFVYPNSGADNIVGSVGTWCAGLCAWGFGAGSYCLLAELGFAFLACWCGWWKNEFFLKTLGNFLILVAVSGFSAFLIDSSSGSPIGPGGCVGALSRYLLDQFFEPLGSYVALSGLIVAGLILVVPLRWVGYLFWSTGLARAVVWLVAPFVKRIYKSKPRTIQTLAGVDLLRLESALAPRRDLIPVENRELRRSSVPARQGYSVAVNTYAASISPTTRDVNVLSAGAANVNPNRPLEINPDDLGVYDNYDRTDNPLFAQAFGPQILDRSNESAVRQAARSQYVENVPEHGVQIVEETISERSAESNAAVCAQNANRNPYPDERADDYQLPPLELLAPGEEVDYEAFREEIEERARELERVCRTYGVELKVVDAQTGPVLTLYEVELKEGLRLQKLERLTNDLAVKLKAEHVRVVSPIPGKNTVGVEVPNQTRQTVRLREVLESCQAEAEKMDIPIFLGRDVVGNPMVADLAALPHLLVAGRTGTGKSVCLNSIIMSVLMTRSPKQCKLIMIDPKMVELSPYKTIPHMAHPVVTDMEKAEAILEWAVEKMESRYRLFARVGARKLSEFNKMPLELMRKRLGPKSEAEWLDFPKSMPSIVIVADEMADLIMTSGKDVERHIIRLAQKSRAVGIHLVLATQKPTVDVITGLIKSNLPARISFGVATQSDSRVVLDAKGAEQLLGNGDMLFLLPGTSTTLRGQGAFVSTQEIDSVVNVISVEEPSYDVVIENPKEQPQDSSGSSDDDLDEFYVPAVEFVIGEGRASTSLLQRKFRIGYGRAARIMDMMTEAGIISPPNPNKPSQPRSILMTMEDWRGKAHDDSDDDRKNAEKTFRARDAENAPEPEENEERAQNVRPVFLDGALPFEAPPTPDRYGNSAANASYDRTTVRFTTPESVGIPASANTPPWSEESENEIAQNARKGLELVESAPASTASAGEEASMQAGETNSEESSSYEELDLTPGVPNDDTLRRQAEEDAEEMDEDLDEFDDEFEEEVVEAAARNSGKSEGWNKEQWEKYLSVEINGDNE